MKKNLFSGILSAVIFFAGCEKDTDGPLNVSKEDFSYDGEGFFAYARLDSGKTIHLSKDTLYLDMGKMWTFSNCALKSINLDYDKEDSVLWIAPTLSIHATAEDCAAPYYRPDTTTWNIRAIALSTVSSLMAKMTSAPTLLLQWAVPLLTAIVAVRESCRASA